MNGSLQNFRKTLLLLVIGGSIIACKEDNGITVTTLRASIDYAKLTDAVSYSKENKLFVDATGQTTLDLTAGNNGYKSLAALNAYNGFCSFERFGCANA